MRGTDQSPETRDWRPETRGQRAETGKNKPGLALLVVVLILGCALIWRLPATDVEWQFSLCENDSLYHLHRVQTCLETFPLVPSIDRYSHHPYGNRVHWPALPSVFYASIARILGIQADQRDALVAWLSWLPPLVGLAAVLLAVAIARDAGKNRWGAYVVGGFCAFSADVCRPFFFGTIDHHLFAHIGILLLVWGRLHQRMLAWLLGLVALLGFTPEASIYVPLVLGCLFLSELAAGVLADTGALRASWFWFLSPTAIAVLSWVVQRHLETAPLSALDLKWTHPTLFQPMWIGVVGLALAGALVGTKHVVRMRRTVPRTILAVGLACLAVVAVCLGFLLWSGALHSITGRVLLSQRLFVGEEASVFSRGFWLAPPWYRILAFSGIFVAARLYGGIRRRADSTYWFVWLMLGAALLLGFMEMRHLYVLSSLQLVGLGLTLFGTERMLRRLPMFSGQLKRALPATVLALATVPVLVTGDIANRVAVHGDVCSGLPFTLALTDWLRDHTPDPASAGGAAPAYGVMAPWSIGHHIRVLGERPVVVDPLNYDLEQSVEQTVRLTWQAKTAAELLDVLSRYQVRYLVLTDVPSSIVSTFRTNGLRREDYVLPQPGQAPVFLPAMNQFAGFRLFMSGGLSGEFGNFQPRYFSRESEIYRSGSGGDYVVVPKAQIYEIKPGAIITGKVPVVQGFRAELSLSRSDQPPVRVSIPLAVGTDGHFRMHTGLPAPVQEEGFRVEGGYVFTAGGRTLVVPVTQSMVDTNAVVEVDWAAEGGS